MAMPYWIAHHFLTLQVFLHQYFHFFSLRVCSLNSSVILFIPKFFSRTTSSVTYSLESSLIHQEELFVIHISWTLNGTLTNYLPPRQLITLTTILKLGEFQYMKSLFGSGSHCASWKLHLHLIPKPETWFLTDKHLLFLDEIKNLFYKS